MKPHYGHTRDGTAVHKHVTDHKLRAHETGHERLDKFNNGFAALITKAVGTMWCAYAFAAFDVISLPAAIHGGPSTIVSWVAQTFLQLVLLSIIMVGQNLQNVASDARSAKTFEDTEETKAATLTALDRLDVHTAGGIADTHAVVVELRDAVNALAGKS